MNPGVLAALVWKDISLYFKNRFFGFVTILGLVFFILTYFLLPETVDETLEMGWYGPPLAGVSLEEMEEGGLILTTYDSEDALRQAILDGEEAVGVALRGDFLASLRAGQKPEAVIYFQADVPDEYRGAYRLLLSEIGFQFAGQPLNIETEEHVLGTDMAGQQVPPRQRMLPLLGVFILMIETWGMAALIASEVEAGTLRALLVTPLTVPGLFLSKGVTGVVMAFGQVLLLFAITGGLRHEPGVVLAALLLGSLLVTGIGFMIASAAHDLMSVFGWGFLALLVLAIPAFSILLPGLTTGWIKILPSYYLIDTVYRVLNFGAGWAESGRNLLVLLAFTVVFFGLGVFALERKLR